MPPDAIESFITRWENSGAAERANYQMFLSELCDILEVPRPDPTSPDPAKNLHVFDRALERAFHQGRGYITSLPVAEGRPPFLLVCDVGHSIDLYAEFSGTGGHYERFAKSMKKRPELVTLPLAA
jgi:hypothetical protein